MADPPPSSPAPARARRRFVPELLETSSTSSSSSSSPASVSAHPPAAATSSPCTSTTTASTHTSKPKRRFAPELVESTSRNNRVQTSSADASREASRANSPKPARARFAPEPIETSTRSVRRKADADMRENPPRPWPRAATAPSEVAAAATIKPARAKRRFAPQLIETAVRSRKTGDTQPAVLASDKTNVTPAPPGTLTATSTTATPAAAAVRPAPAPPTNTPRHSAPRVPTLSKPWPTRQGSIRPHYNTRNNTRQHSYMVPRLDDIESSQSGDSRAPSLSRSNSAPSEASDEAYKHATRLRESVDDRFSGYLLALAARAAEKQLRDQEAAAFATSDYHQPVAHYVDDDASEEDSVSSPTAADDGSSTRNNHNHVRQDSADERIALDEMRRHGERLSKEKMQRGPKLDHARPAERRRTGVFNVEFDGDVNYDAWSSPAAPKNLIGGHQRDPDLKQMRKAASPPMLGGDLDFPRCPSPEHARFDVTQGCDFLKASMCSLSEQGMWGGPGGGSAAKQGSSVSKHGANSTSSSASSKGRESSCSQSKPKAGGLWGGFCTQKDAKLTPPPVSGLVTPLQTPQVEKPDPFSMFASGGSGASIAGKRPSPPPLGGAAPPSPPPSNSDRVGLLETAAAEAQLEREFDHAFVTQVYNYLSLGYPALARKFDDELSRISRVPVDALRQDDELVGARGYLRLGDDEAGAADGVDVDDCQRWAALRVYIREWGKQLVVGKQREVNDPHRAWGLAAGLPARKGSWGI